jgi:hypothetical protein
MMMMMMMMMAISASSLPKKPCPEKTNSCLLKSGDGTAVMNYQMDECDVENSSSSKRPSFVLGFVKDKRQ